MLVFDLITRKNANRLSEWNCEFILISMTRVGDTFWNRLNGAARSITPRGALHSNCRLPLLRVSVPSCFQLILLPVEDAIIPVLRNIYM